jgi:hypothetical protein
MGEAASRETRAEAPTATKPEAAGYSVISTEQTINQPERPGAPLPTVCRSLAGTLCGSFLTSSGPCRRWSVRGCPLRRLPGYHLDGVSA